MKSGPHVTLADVAQSADVSLATASRVLNGTASVRTDLRDRVMSAAAELAYAPNAHAQALAGGTHRTVGVICHDVSDPYFSTIAGGVMKVANANGMLVMLADTFRDPDREVAYVSMLRAQRASAIVLIGSAFEDRSWERAMAAELDPYRRGGGQVAAVSRHRGLKVDTVLPDNRGGAAALAKALVGLGHKRFAVLAGPSRLTTVCDRVDGFAEELAAHGVPLSEDDVLETSFDRDGGYDAAKRLLERPKRRRPTCVFAVTDLMATGALAALREAGVSVPGQMSVAGFDDIPVVRDLTPALTTVALPLEKLGERAMDFALKCSGTRARTVRFGAEVMLRESTARPRR